MELINATRLLAAYTMGTDPTAREHIVVAVKGTFAFPEQDGEVCPLAEEQGGYDVRRLSYPETDGTAFSVRRTYATPGQCSRRA